MLTLAAFSMVVGLSAATVSTYSQGFCVTARGTKSVAVVPTKTNALTLRLPALATVAVTPSITIRPTTRTTTSTILTTSTSTTTAGVITDTFTSTTTFYETTSLISTSTTTIIVPTDATITTSGDLTTIAASAGFTPLASRLPPGNTAQTASATAVGSSRKRSTINERRLEANALAERGASPNPAQLCIHPKAKSYPTSVVCKKLVEIVSTLTLTRTVKKTATVTASTPTSTAYTTSTVVTITTSVPVDASTTVTESTTSTLSTTTTITESTTTTSTNTVFVAGPTPTVYAACASNNIVTGVNGQLVVYVDSENYSQVSGPGNAYDCCTACQQATSGTCSAFIFTATRGGCYFVPQTDGSCNPQKSGNSFFSGSVPGIGPDDGLTVGNSGCGYLAYGGVYGG